MQDLKNVVLPFYTKCLTVNLGTNVADEMDKILADDFQSLNTKETKDKAQLIGQIQFFWKLVPDLKWEPQEVLQESNKVVVRSLASGTPNGDFMGLATNGTKSFSMMSIDIHTVENGQIKTVHHIEEWGTAMAQLKG